MGKNGILLFAIEELTSSFEYNELKVASKMFEKIVLVTFSEVDTNKLESNIDVHRVSFQNYSSEKNIFRWIVYTPLFISELVKCPRYIISLKLFIRSLSSFMRALYISDKIQEILLKYSHANETKVLLSFWFGSFASSLALLKQRKLISAIVVTRAHGVDLYEERIPIIRHIPFRNHQLKHFDLVLPVSNKGSEYLKRKYPQYSGKIHTSYLGTSFYGRSILKEDKIFTIVSCAKIRNLKRVYLVPQILMKINFPVRWVHIGGEDTQDPTWNLFDSAMNNLKKGRDDIEVRMMGEMSNYDVLNYYKNESINLFLSVSETEGLPVSIMEAISAGIPVMATDVGGCCEIVTPLSGILIPKDFNSEAVARQIEVFALSEYNTQAYRDKVYNFWKSNFDIEANYSKFYELISNQSSKTN